MALYHLRLIERLWGSRKFASFLFTLYPLASLIPPLLLALAVRPLSFSLVNALPAGPTTLVFALLAQYQAAIPTVYKWRLVTGSGTNAGGNVGRNAPGQGQADSAGIQSVLTFSDKTTTYLLALQLALSQLPGSALAALVGYGLGVAYRNGVLPERLVEWRLPGWMIGGSGMVGRREGEGFEGLRRRLEGEGRASGIEAAQGGEVRAR
ncbi:MAG: hypothetical protein MMC23_004148 [Stictis urceolatum]|nr:hypothetical protein [Stictis urceolata]